MVRQRWREQICLLWILVIWCTGVAGAALRMEAGYDTTVVDVGAVFSFRARVSVPDHLEFVSLTTNSGSADLPVRLETVRSNSSSDATLFLLQGSAQVFEIRDCLFPGFLLRVRRAGKEEAYRFGRLPLHVTPPLIDRKKQPPIRGPKGPLSMAQPFTWLPALLGGILLLSVLVLVYLVRRRRRLQPSLQAVAELDPWEVARRRLDDLGRAFPGENENEALKQLYLDLSDTVRTYLDARCREPFLEATTGETALLLARVPWLDEEVQNRGMELFRESDLVKFAKYKPGSEEVPAYHGAVTAWLRGVEDRYQSSLAYEQGPDPDEHEHPHGREEEHHARVS